MDPLLTPEEIAARYKVAAATVRRWCTSGKLKGTKAGRQWRIDPRDLEAFFKSQEVKTEDPKANGLAVAPARPSFALWAAEQHPPPHVYSTDGNGRGDWIRTSDLLNPIQVRYQTALRPAMLIIRCLPGIL
jgi:excisionase family DNA binding protein